MGSLRKVFFAVSLVAILFCGASAQSTGNTSASTVADKKQPNKSHRTTFHPLTKKERKTLVAVALSDHVQREEDESDCSHLVHSIYEQAGFPYKYAPSDDIYAGVAGFYRVKAPLAGDLVVWHGHVGIVIKPSKHSFFSSLSSGPGTDDYKSPYWKRRGLPRFYRYIKREAARGATKLNEPIR